MSIRSKFLFAVLGFAAIVALAATAPAPAGADPIELAQSGNLMQCMEQCIRSEGKAEKATCKSRCATISTKRPKQKDCMGNYKRCQKSCPKGNNSCRKGCKARLMKCS